MSVQQITNQLFDLHQQLSRELAVVREEAARRTRFFTNDPAYLHLSAMCSAVSLAADLGGIVRADQEVSA